MWARIKEWWSNLWKKKTKPPKKAKPPENVTKLTRTETDMPRDVNITWALPTNRTGGAVLANSEISNVEVEMSADGGANFVPLNTIVATDTQAVNIPDLEAGDYQFRFTVHLVDGQESSGVIQPVTIADDSPPENITDIEITQT